MKKIYTILVLITVPLFLTACTKNKETEIVTDTRNDSDITQESENIKGSVFDITKLGKNVRCTFEYEDENGKSRGETFVSKNKSMSLYTMKPSEGEDINSYVLTDGEWAYMWSSASNQGTKINIADIEKEQEEGDPDENYEKYKNPVDYKCSVWIPDESKFKVPENITFIELTDLLNQFKNGVDTKAVCGMCDTLENADEVKDCKDRLGCE